VDSVTARRHAVIVVGEGMVGTPGISARVFTALAGGIASPSHRIGANISLAVAEADAADATPVHAAFQLSKIGGGRPVSSPRTDVVLLGFGRVGRALADQIGAANGKTRVRVVGLLDRSGYVFEPRGLSRRRLLGLTREKDRGRLLAALGGRRAAAAEALTFMASHAVSRPLVVDVTRDGRRLFAKRSRTASISAGQQEAVAGAWELRLFPRLPPRTSDPSKRTCRPADPTRFRNWSKPAIACGSRDVSAGR
jgi:hypothetical protein